MNLIISCSLDIFLSLYKIPCKSNLRKEELEGIQFVTAKKSKELERGGQMVYAGRRGW